MSRSGPSPRRRTSKPTRASKLHIPKIRTEASASGFHFADLFNNCQRKFWLRFGCRLEPSKKALPLLFGSAFHHGAACYYVTGDAEVALVEGQRALRDQRREMEMPELLEAQCVRLGTLILKWTKDRGSRHLRDYEILGVETEIEAPVPGLDGFVFTGRLDMVGRSRRSGFLHVIEHKTAGYSITLTEDSLRYGDQATAEIWLASHKWPREHVKYVIPDIAYWPRSSSKSEQINCYEGDPIVRTKSDVSSFKSGISQLFSEISQKVLAVEGGRDPDPLFRRNTHYCVSFGRVCEYAEICRDHRVTRGWIPSGFIQGRRLSLGDIGRLVGDEAARD